MPASIVVKKDLFFNFGPKISANSYYRKNRSGPQKIIDLSEGPLFSAIEFTIVRRYPRRTLKSESWTGSVAMAHGVDETGSIRLVLWGNQVDRVSSGDRVVVENGWCALVNNQLIISAGRTGELVVHKLSQESLN